MEGQAARIARYAVLAVFLSLTRGLAGLVPANLPPGLRLENAGMVGILLICLVFSALSAWEALHRCRRQGLVTGAVLLAIASLVLPTLAVLDDACREPEARGAAAVAPLPVALLAVGGLWGLAGLGGVPASRERRRLLAAG